MLLIICAYTDYKKGKIYNKYLFIFLVFYIVFCVLELIIVYITDNKDLPLLFAQYKNNLFGFLVAFIISFVFYILGIFKGGDAKLLSIVGLCSGLDKLFDHFSIILITSGVVALFLLIKNKILFKRLKRVFLYFRGILLTHSFEKYTTEADNNIKFPFAVYVLFGEILTYLLYFLRR